MKQLMALLALSAITFCSFAQEGGKVKGSTMQDSSMMKNGNTMRDCIFMKNGQVMVCKNGKKMKLDQNMTLMDGSTVMPDGSINKTDGTTKKLKEGHCVYMDGKMGKMGKMKKNMKMSADEDTMNPNP